MNTPVNRREFLKRGLLAATTLPYLHPVIAAASWDAIRPAGAARKVIVIGAGLAGLSSAYELTQAGHEVTVLEARTRSGGRVWTLRDSFPEGLYAEAGATNVFDNHEWTMRYVKELGVALDPMESTGGASIFHIRGKRIVIKSGSPVEWPLELKPEEKGLSRGALWAKYVAPVVKELGDPGAEGWPPASLKRRVRRTGRRTTFKSS